MIFDEILELIAKSFKNFKLLVLSSCEGFSTDGLASIAANCRFISLLLWLSIRIGKTLKINLNEFPGAYRADSTAIPETLTYQRKHQNMVKAKRNMEHDTDPGKDIMGL
ncbi:hypothetical protein RchiOBHm_Chr4g0403301 [Rosa chinensis]|uniref:Uncharacterized protein n=1 Tax=Rosa chinensis TaxID=74649 RepID=A0A2P6QTK8_ROSCH|nr:protein TRANSPORT INHIBITOR RESPONSE 1 [Rosa chinensis]PRQ37506.1 hypothetical protein RchiOBHm_Chr4g0403301 [Rosa chinensis]